MAFLPDVKKASVNVILSRMKNGKASDMEVMSEAPIGAGVKDDAFVSFAEDLMQALQDKSVQGVAEVLESYFEYSRTKEMQLDKMEE